MELQEHHQHAQWSDTESNCSSRLGYSGPLRSMSTNIKSNARVKDDKDEECYVEITLDVHDDSVLVHSIKGAGDPETALLASHLELRPSSLGAQLSFRLRQVSQELRRITSTKGCSKQIDRTRSGAAQALRGLRFMTKNVEIDQGWSEVEARFNELALNGMLPKSLFGQCIGMSIYFAKKKC